MRGFYGLFVAVGAALGCAPQPIPRALRAASFDATELVAYGPLTRADFKGSMSSGFARGEEERIGAASCVKIMVRPPDVVTRAVAGGYVATFEDPIFFSMLSRNCSWWRPEEALSAEQVLEHEQIHFAIDELEARRLNARVDDLERQIYSAGPELGAVSQRAQGELRAILEAAQRRSLERSTVFDYQVARDRVRQRAWFHKVMAELDATRAYARGPQANPIAAVVLESAPAESAPTLAPPATAPAPPAAPPPAPLATPAPAAPPASVPAVNPALPAPARAPVTPPNSTGSFPD